MPVLHVEDNARGAQMTRRALARLAPHIRLTLVRDAAALLTARSAQCQATWPPAPA